jgi:hypothetical protein
MWLPDLLVPAAEPVDVQASRPLRRRRIVTGVTLVVGTTLLAATLRVRPGSSWFSALGFLVALTWIAGGLLSGPVPFRGEGPRRAESPDRLEGPRRAESPDRPESPDRAETPDWPESPDRAETPGRPWPRIVAAALVVGGVAFLGFLAADLVGQQISWVASALRNVLGKADAGPRAVVLVIALVNAVAEEIFFRGALLAALEPRRPALTSTIIYVAVTAASGNIALVAAGAVMGTIFMLERLSTRSILAPVVTHLSWSALIFFLLPR